MENKIIDFLRKEYNAQAIILHGSRARNNARPNSDWDILVFTNDVIKETGGSKLEGQEIDVKIVKLPIEEDLDDFVSSFPQSMHTIKVLFDNDECIAGKIFEVSRKKYSKGPGITEDKLNYIRSHLDRMIFRLMDNKDEPESFFYHLAQFYVKTIRYWFEYQNRWSQPIYDALAIFEEEDKEFLKELKIIAGEGNVYEKMKAVENMKVVVLGKRRG